MESEIDETASIDNDGSPIGSFERYRSRVTERSPSSTRLNSSRRYYPILATYEYAFIDNVQQLDLSRGRVKSSSTASLLERDRPR